MTANFGFLASHDSILERLGTLAESYFQRDPVTCLIKLRQFGEVIAQRAAAQAGLYASPEENQVDLLRRLRDRGLLTREVADLFHGLRKAGNTATHELRGDHGEALHQLKMARLLAVWFFRSFKDAKFQPGPFLPPPDPEAEGKALKDELACLRKEFEQKNKAAGAAEDEIKKLSQDKAALDALAHDLEAKAAALAKQLEEAQAQAKAAPPAVVEKAVAAAFDAGQRIELDEAATRKIIDQQLQSAGWTADSQALRYKDGARPQKGKNLAISEYPTPTGPADYVLFVGLRPIAVVEAKRSAKDVSGSLEQAKRYGRAFQPAPDHEPNGGPWGQEQIPFLYSTNGRPYLRQLETKSGIWFRDARKPENHGRALEGWHTPDELRAMLEADMDAAKQALANEPPDYLPVRDYQRAAIQAVEKSLLDGQRQILIAMATGTGKTRTLIALIYRLIKAKMFRRVLFLVDRSALGEQATNAFKDVKLENYQSFTDIYDLKELADIKPDPDTRVQVATIQGLVKRVLETQDTAEIPSIGQYDCIVVDECHRGYSLDREMTDAELTFRSEQDYISTYRRVLDHFDAVKIGLTATPAPHTLEIFGEPVFYYSYRQAVIDGYLVDHEPPLRIITKLAQDGITWKAGEEILVLDQRTQQINLFNTLDEVSVNVEEFNSRVVTENFNKVVCEHLAQHLDPSLPGKTLIFCVDDDHADLVVKLLKAALDDRYGGIDDDAVQKITGKADKPLEKIRRFRNEKLPSVAVTVDLLSTGIDVPEIVNIVFIRRVKSRILYEQMMGRATRLCPDIKKERFRIFDAVDLYKTLEDYTDMRPVVTNPNLSFAQLVKDVCEVKSEEARREFLEQLVAKLQRKKRTLKDKHAQEFETLAGLSPEALISKLKGSEPAQAAEWFAAHPQVAAFLDEIVGEGRKKLVATHGDSLVGTERGYGSAKKPDDFLEGFKNYLNENMDRLPALVLVAQRPRDLTRKQLRELRLELDRQGFSEEYLRTAWKEKTNADIAASIIGFIRRELLDSPLLTFEERVDKAVKRILANRPWSEPQRKWLEAIAKQVKKEVIVDRDALDTAEFKQQAGGFNRLNKIFDGKLIDLLAELHEDIWTDTAA